MVCDVGDWSRNKSGASLDGRQQSSAKRQNREYKVNTCRVEVVDMFMVGCIAYLEGKSLRKFAKAILRNGFKKVPLLDGLVISGIVRWQPNY